MKRKKSVIPKAMRSRFNYYKKKGFSIKQASTLAIGPKYVREEFRQVRKLHGQKYALRWVVAKYGRRY